MYIDGKNITLSDARAELMRAAVAMAKLTVDGKPTNDAARALMDARDQLVLLIEAESMGLDNRKAKLRSEMNSLAIG